MRSDEATDDRTEAPTPRRLREARESGRVVVSRDLAAAIVMLASAGALLALGSRVLSGMRAMMSQALGGLHEATASGSTAAVASAGASFLGTAAPLLLVLLVAAAGATTVQVGFLFAGGTLLPKWERLDPVAGLRRAFSMRTFVGVVSGLVKGALIFGLMAVALWQERDALAGLSLRPLPEALGVVSRTALVLAGKTALGLLALGLVDWSYRRWQHRRDLRMSRREIQDELREFEGDPASGDRRRAHKGRLDAARVLSRLPEADVLVADDRDLVVALKLDASAEGSPVVVAKGRGALADKLREAALAGEIPVIERADLARSLHKRTGADGAVAADLRSSASDVVALARDMKGTGLRSE